MDYLSSLKNPHFTKKMILFLPFILLCHHFSLWIVTSYSHDLKFIDILSNWDSGWYVSIVKNGYDLKSIAFYPLYPLAIKLLTFIAPDYMPIQIIGSIFSTILFSVFCILIYRLYLEKEKYPTWLLPQSVFGFFFFLYAPASYIFHSNHTESLFLLLSFLSLFYAKKNWILASIFAGLCALTKNQGVILAITVALLCASNYNEKIKKIKVFIFSGIISGAFFSLFLIFQALYLSNPFAFIQAQSHWDHVSSIAGYFNTFLEIARFKEIPRFYLIEIIFYYVFLAGSILLYKKSKAVFLYAIVSLLLMPMQASLINVFRFSIFIFPLYFVVGDFIFKRNKIIIIMLFIFLIYLNHQMARNYILSRWSY
jgi:hypothetical protein